MANETSVGTECPDFRALGGLRIDHTGGVGARCELMGSVPMARGSGDAADSLQAASALMQALKIVAGGAVDEQNVGQSTLRGVIEQAAVGSQTEIVFDGASLIFDKEGNLCKTLPSFEEAVEGVTLNDDGSIVESTFDYIKPIPQIKPNPLIEVHISNSLLIHNNLLHQ